MSTDKQHDPNERIECRVVAINYGAAIQGETIKVTRRAVEQSTNRDQRGAVISRALLPLDEEKALLEAAQKPEAVQRRHDVDRARAKGWQDLTATAERMNKENAREAETGALQAILERLGPQPAKPSGKAA